MWSYSQRSGTLARNGVFAGKGYAGRDAGKNNPDMQNVPATGPLPRGHYTIQAPHDSDQVGKYALALVPDPANEMFGRSAFYIHGDSASHPGDASHGCIVIAPDIRRAVWLSGDHALTVTV